MVICLLESITVSNNKNIVPIHVYDPILGIYSYNAIERKNYVHWLLVGIANISSIHRLQITNTVEYRERHLYITL